MRRRRENERGRERYKERQNRIENECIAGTNKVLLRGVFSRIIIVFPPKCGQNKASILFFIKIINVT